MLRIVTENKYPARIKEILRRENVDFTMYTATGSWKGVEEPSLVLEFEGYGLEKILAVDLAIKYENKQESVMLQTIPVETRFI
jgi:hypothetical protein